MDIIVAVAVYHCVKIQYIQTDKHTEVKKNILYTVYHTESFCVLSSELPSPLHLATCSHPHHTSYFQSSLARHNVFVCPIPPPVVQL